MRDDVRSPGPYNSWISECVEKLKGIPAAKDLGTATQACASLHILRHYIGIVLKDAEENLKSCQQRYYTGPVYIPALTLAPLTTVEKFVPTQTVLNGVKNVFNSEHYTSPINLNVIGYTLPVAHIVATQWNEDHKWMEKFAHDNRMTISHCTKYREDIGKDNYNLECISANVTNETSSYLKWIISNFHQLSSDYVAPWIICIHGHDKGWHQMKMDDPTQHITGEDFLQQTLSVINNPDTPDYIGINFHPVDLFEHGTGVWSPINGMKFIKIFFPRTATALGLGNELNLTHADCCAQFAVKKRKIIDKGFEFWLQFYAETLENMNDKMENLSSIPDVKNSIDLLTVRAKNDYVRTLYVSSGFHPPDNMNLFNEFNKLLFEGGLSQQLRDRNNSFELLNRGLGDRFGLVPDNDTNWLKLRKAAKACSADVQLPQTWVSAVAAEVLWTQIFL